MVWQIFSLYPQIFQSFLETSLIARAIDKKILEFEIINWRTFAVGNYKQVDDRPFGGGSGMVLQVEPIVKALVAHNSLSDFGKIQLLELDKDAEINNINHKFFDKKENNLDVNLARSFYGKIDKEAINQNQILLSQNLSDQVLQNFFTTELEPKTQINSSNLQEKNTFLSHILPNNSKFYNWFENEKKVQEKLPENLEKDKNIEQTSRIILENSYFDQICESFDSKNKSENEQNNSNNQFKNKDLKTKKSTILLTPRGFPLSQKICNWLSSFDQISLICGRFEGFDYRANQIIDLEISIGDFVCNGGEIPAMCLIEAVSRLIPGFITKSSSHLHDSFSDQNNQYLEQQKFVIGKNKLQEFEQDCENLQEIKNKLENLHIRLEK